MQFENVMERLQNCIHFLHEGQEILSHKYAIKLHSLLHHQLRAPVVGDILCCVWHSSKLTKIGHFLELR
jgi:hypothetical protein